MKILDDLLATLDCEAQVRDICLGPFQTAVLTRNCGLASTPHDPGPHHEHNPILEAGRLLEKDASEVAQMAHSQSPFEATIGLAAINSLLEVDEGRCTELNAADLLVERGKDSRIAIVGHFPFVPRLRQAARELWVIERQPHPGDFAEEEAARLIPEADVVAITGASFINHTIEYLLSLCRTGAYVIVLGGTAPLSPVLFDYGVDAVAGTKVVEPELVLRCVRQGGTYRQLKGIQRLILRR